MRRYPLYGNVIVDSSNSTALGGTLTISNSCNTSSLNNRASLAFAVADISYGILKKGLLSGGVDSADARITAIIDTVSPTVGTAISVSVSPNHSNPPVEALRIRSNGNVGIGTQTPRFTLDVNGIIGFQSNIDNKKLVLSDNSPTDNPTTATNFYGFGINAAMLRYQTDTNISTHAFFGGSTEYMRIAGGNMGIGVTSPTTSLDMKGTLTIRNSADNVFAALNTGNGTFFTIDAFNNGNTIKYPVCLAAYGGNVGIGTTAPTQMLGIQAGMRVNQNNNSHNKLLVLWDAGVNDPVSSATLFYGLGINSGILRYQTANNADAHAFFGGSTEYMRIVGGSVGIGTTNPRTRLHVNYNGVNNGMINENSIANTINARDTLLPLLANSSIIGPSPSGTNIYMYWKNESGTRYSWLATGTALFTGQHMVVPDNSDLKINLTEYVGLIVSSNDTGYTSYYNGIKSTGIDAINICEALPNCKLSDKDNDKAVFGVITNQKNDEYFDTDGTPLYDNIDNGFEKSLYDRIRVNSVGEGSMWVTNINGSLENGDYITSSAIPGYGKRQNDDLLHNYTVAKSTMSCDFILNSPNYKTKSVIWDGNTYIAAFIGCTYHCG